MTVEDLRKKDALLCSGTRAYIFVSLAKRQQGEQAVSGVGIIFKYSLSSAQSPHDR